MKRVVAPILFFILIVLFSVKSTIMLDPDFGWHVRLGNIYLHHGIQETDPLSYSMPSYPFIDHEWLLNMFLFWGYTHIGMIGLSLLAAFVTAGAIFLSIKSSARKWYLIPFLLVGCVFLSFMGVRTQVVTWFLFSFLLWILSEEKRYETYALGIPLTIAVWVNLHGGFAIGIAMLFLFLIVRSISRKFQIKDAVIFLLSVAMTGINPYGYRIWWEIWMQMSDSSLHWRIMEWFPAVTYASSFTLWLFFALSIVLVLEYRNHFSLQQHVFYFAFLLLGISSIRHIPFWLLTALPMTLTSVMLLFKESGKHPLSRRHFRIAYRVLLGITIVVLSAELFYDYEQSRSMSEGAFYPEQAIVYLKKHPSKGNIFSHYNYGGYLDWKLPEKKVFIDGRMPSWRWHTPGSRESNNAFADWENISQGRSHLKKTFTTYAIDTVLWFPESNNQKVSLYGKFIAAIARFLHLHEESDQRFINQLHQNGFHIVYQDDHAAIYRKSL